MKEQPDINVGCLGQSQEENKMANTGSKDTQKNQLNVNPDIGAIKNVNQDLATEEPSKKKTYRQPYIEKEYTFTPAKISSWRPESVE